MISTEKAAALLQQRTGHHYLNLERLQRALTHSSAQSPSGSTYERLEYLADRVLGIAVAPMLFETFPEASEGELSVRLNALANAENCVSIPHEIGLAEF